MKVRVKQAAHREKKKKKKIVEDVDEVGGGSRQLLDSYMSRDFAFFMSLASVDDLVYARGGLYRTHRLYNCVWDWNFWGRLMGKVDGGWLESWVCFIIEIYNLNLYIIEIYINYVYIVLLRHI